MSLFNFKKKKTAKTSDVYEVGGDTKTEEIVATGEIPADNVETTKELESTKVFSADQTNVSDAEEGKTIVIDPLFGEQKVLEKNDSSEIIETNDGEEYEYVTINYGKNAFVLTIVCVVIGMFVCFFLTKDKMIDEIRTAYQQQGYMITNGATATASEIAEGKTAYVKGAKITGTYVEIDTTQATATSTDILQGYTAYAKGQKIVGAIPTYNGLFIITPSNNNFTIYKGVYLPKDITIVGDEDLIPSRIKADVKIFGVTGSYK